MSLFMKNSHDHDDEKTASRRTTRSQLISDAPTTKPYEVKHKSQVIPNTKEIFYKNDKCYEFHVYPEKNLFKNPELLPTIEIQVDEDVQTTESVRKYGENLCLEDLHEHLSNLHESSYRQETE